LILIKERGSCDARRPVDGARDAPPGRFELPGETKGGHTSGRFAGRAGLSRTDQTIWTDLTKWLSKLRSAAQRESSPPGREALLAAMVATSSDAIITIDAKGIIQSFNPAAEQLFGYAEKEVLGRNVKMLMPPHFRSEHDGYLARYQRTGERRIIGIGRVVAGEKKDGSTFPLELAVGETRIEEAPVFVGFIRDLTEKQTEQRRVQELQQELFHVSRLGEMGQIASSLAHEVNQPLAAIMNYLQVGRQLAADGPADGPMKGILEKVEAQTARAAEIVKRLRNFIDRREFERRPESAAQVIEEALALGMVGPASRTTRTVLQLVADCPDVEIDRVQIQQVLVNLIRNAIDAMEGQPRRELAIASSLEDGYVKVAVSDSGPGVSPDVRDKLFGAFVTTKEQGMGVGLSICRAIVENHGGKIWFEANPQGGTTFTFTLPIYKALADAHDA
jgi:two-component system sensor kinase FixL